MGRGGGGTGAPAHATIELTDEAKTQLLKDAGTEREHIDRTMALQVLRPTVVAATSSGLVGGSSAASGAGLSGAGGAAAASGVGSGAAVSGLGGGAAASGLGIGAVASGGAVPPAGGGGPREDRARSSHSRLLNAMEHRDPWPEVQLGGLASLAQSRTSDEFKTANRERVREGMKKRLEDGDYNDERRKTLIDQAADSLDVVGTFGERRAGRVEFGAEDTAIVVNGAMAEEQTRILNALMPDAKHITTVSGNMEGKFTEPGALHRELETAFLQYLKDKAIIGEGAFRRLVGQQVGGGGRLLRDMPLQADDMKRVPLPTEGGGPPLICTKADGYELLTALRTMYKSKLIASLVKDGRLPDTVCRLSLPRVLELNGEDADAAAAGPTPWSVSEDLDSVVDLGGGNWTYIHGPQPDILPTTGRKADATRYMEPTLGHPKLRNRENEMEDKFNELNKVVHRVTDKQADDTTVGNELDPGHPFHDILGRMHLATVLLCEGSRAPGLAKAQIKWVNACAKMMDSTDELGSSLTNAAVIALVSMPRRLGTELLPIGQQIDRYTHSRVFTIGNLSETSIMAQPHTTSITERTTEGFANALTMSRNMMSKPQEDRALYMQVVTDFMNSPKARDMRLLHLRSGQPSSRKVRASGLEPGDVVSIKAQLPNVAASESARPLAMVTDLREGDRRKSKVRARSLETSGTIRRGLEYLWHIDDQWPIQQEDLRETAFPSEEDVQQVEQAFIWAREDALVEARDAATRRLTMAKGVSALVVGSVVAYAVWPRVGGFSGLRALAGGAARAAVAAGDYAIKAVTAGLKGGFG